MGTLWTLLVAILRFVIEWIKGRPTEVAPIQDPNRVPQLEDEATRERLARLREVNARAEKSTSRGDADELLRSVTGADDPNVN